MKWKVVIGIVLAVASFAALYLWETKFEDEITLTPVVVLAENHKAGDVIETGHLRILKINPGAKLDNALTEDQVSLIVGKVLKINLVQNQQLLSEYFMDKKDVIPDDCVNFVIPSSWIYSKSRLITERDTAQLYAMPEKVYLGTYKISLLYDGAIEIIAKLEDYFKIYDIVTKPFIDSHSRVVNNQLLFVMEDDL